MLLINPFVSAINTGLNNFLSPMSEVKLNNFFKNSTT